MADDDRLLDLLGRALAAPPAEPSPEGVARVRRLADGATPARSPAPVRPPAWHLRRSWQAGIAGIAAALVLALLALPGLVRSCDGSGDTRTAAPGTSAAVSRLRVALQSEDPVAVARADADLLLESRNQGRSEQETAVAAHIAAVQFLRDHPSPDVLAEVAPPETAAPGDPAVVVTPSDPAPDGAGEEAGTTDPVPTAVVPGHRSVTILGIVPLLDGTFQVAYAVSGFTPDASGLPDTYSVRFSFDDGQSPVAWGGPSPWSFPVAAGLAYQRLCAHVADAAGVVDPASGGCRDIL
ncbi:MAG: hypothetical protein ACR2HV_04725 [Acidimicrobiales bacterium]